MSVYVAATEEKAVEYLRKQRKNAHLNADGSVSKAVAREWLGEYLKKCYKELNEILFGFLK